MKRKLRKLLSIILATSLIMSVTFVSPFTPVSIVSAADFSDEAIIFDVEYTGKLIDPSENFTYNLNVPSYGTVTIGAYYQGASIRLHVYDTKGIELAYVWKFSDEGKASYISIALEKGDYSLVIEQANPNKTGAYYFTCTYQFNSSTNAKVSSPNTGELKVTAPKGDKVNAFEVRYKTSGDESWTVKTITTTKNLNETLTGLKKGAKYKVQTRKMVIDKYGYNHYSDWTEVQTVTIKK